MTERVTVTSPRGRAVRAPRRRSRGDLTGPGTGRIRPLIRAQARIALATCAVVAAVTGGLPMLFACETGLSRVLLFGVRLPWLIMCVAVPLVWVAAARRHVRLAERVELDFARHGLAAQGLAEPGPSEPAPAGPGSDGPAPDGPGPCLAAADPNAQGTAGEDLARWDDAAAEGRAREGLVGQRSAEAGSAEAARSE